MTATTATAAAAVAESSAPATLTFFYLLIPALILYFVYWKLQRRRFVELGEKIPGPEGYPIVGHAFLLLGSASGKFHSRGFKKFGNTSLCVDSKRYFLAVVGV
jgi:cytochrome P450 family 4